MFQKQPNTWSCLATSFAIVLNVKVEDLFNEIGHDGSEVWWPGVRPPNNRRGHHIQELINCCLNRSLTVTTIEPRPQLFSPEQQEANIKYGTNYLLAREIEIVRDFESILSNRDGVLTGENRLGNRHAVAWINNQLIDPSLGECISISRFNIQCFYWISQACF